MAHLYELALESYLRQPEGISNAKESQGASWQRDFDLANQSHHSVCLFWYVEHCPDGRRLL